MVRVASSSDETCILVDGIVKAVIDIGFVGLSVMALFLMVPWPVKGRQSSMSLWVDMFVMSGKGCLASESL